MLERSDYFILGAAFISFLLSVSIWFGAFGEANQLAALFVGIWVPSILALGNYFKVKSAGKQT